MANINKDYFKVNEPIKQNEVKDILNDNEEVLLDLKPERKVYILESILKGLPLVLVWGGIDFFVIFLMITSGSFNEIGMSVLFVLVFFALHLIPVWLYVGRVVKRVWGYKNLSYTFTDKRIIIRSGLIGIDFRFVYYSDIASVDVKVGILDRMFKVGDLYIKSPTQALVLDDIKSPYQYGDKIQDLVRDLKADINFPNNYRPETNDGYKTKYTKK